VGLNCSKATFSLFQHNFVTFAHRILKTVRTTKMTEKDFSVVFLAIAT